MLRAALTTISLAAAFAVSACGSDGKTNEAAEKAPPPGTARSEAAATSLALVEALAAYRSGDRASARDQVSEAYLQHFERVEEALDARDHELKERLEDAIRDELRHEMAQGAPSARVSTLVRRILRDLATAQARLR
jgi:hypothetical protein